MRKFAYSCIFLSLILLAGCVSMGKDKNLSHYSPIGIVSVVSNYDINWFGEEPMKASAASDLLSKALSRRKDDTRTKISNAEELINEADALLYDMLPNAGIAAFADKSRIVQSKAYNEAKITTRPEKTGKIKADGYRFIDPKDKASVSAIAAETGSNALMFITFDFTKNIAMGIGKNGSFRAKITMDITIVDNAGKTIYKKAHEGESYDKISVSNELYEEDELMDLFRSALSDLYEDLIWDFKDLR